ncbi:uncharacterized protein EDB91DRAFT_1079243 [Suillus paluster]|uniref:uncharacterized protein n=1 Tax=Suillus paluster TaxID=48578 RepID=UPI001B874733|nr:uncharacterized protein EDB91DRAFT_1079243 [Suillus paluster]KAG1749169.1 hypothetical protein EDB91DRAFT_1079243 [Suillus paluster]
MSQYFIMDSMYWLASDGNIQVYERSNDALFTFQSTTMGHSGAVESLLGILFMVSGECHWWSPASLEPNTRQWAAYLLTNSCVARTVHFYYNGASLLICYSIEPWDLKWRKKVQGRIGNAVLEGSFLLVSNLKDRVDKYTVPTTQCIQSFNHVILCNVPLQISVAQQEFGLDKLLFARIDGSLDS